MQTPTDTHTYIHKNVRAETAGMQKAVKEFLDMHLKGSERQACLGPSTQKNLVSPAR